MIGKTIWPFCLVLSQVAMLAGCSRPATSVTPSTSSENELEITPSPGLILPVKVGSVQTAAVEGRLRVASRVEADETRMARVSSRVTGRVLDMSVFEGQLVRRGQVLAKVYSADLSIAQSSFLKAQSQCQLATRAVARAKDLVAAGVIGEAEFQRREAESLQATADASAAREQLEVLGLTKAGIQNLEKSRVVNSITPIESPIDGVILQRKATIGEAIEAAETLFVVADLSQVWLVADVPEQSAAVLRVGASVEAEIPSLPNERIAGTVSFVSPLVTTETRTVRVRMDLANPNHKFKPNMLATMTLLADSERRQVIPSTAVVREGNDDTVFVQTGFEQFVLRRVTLGDEVHGLRIVTNGLHEGEQIVVDGAFHLNNERKRRLLQGNEGT